ncbi:Os08g0546300, partial [Oryza sativa Japonica Group]
PQRRVLQRAQLHLPGLRLQRHQHHEQPAFQMPPQPDQLLCLRRDES